MMCLNCRMAGDMNGMGRCPQESIREVHGMCEYPKSCTCQHATGGQWVEQ